MTERALQWIPVVVGMPPEGAIVNLRFSADDQSVARFGKREGLELLVSAYEDGPYNQTRNPDLYEWSLAAPQSVPQEPSVWDMLRDTASDQRGSAVPAPTGQEGISLGATPDSSSPQQSDPHHKRLTGLRSLRHKYFDPVKPNVLSLDAAVWRRWR